MFTRGFLNKSEVNQKNYLKSDISYEFVRFLSSWKIIKKSARPEGLALVLVIRRVRLASSTDVCCDLVEATADVVAQQAK
jgi:hypothetical protein